jgi:quinone-modifying oxidoreductase, subunit QmoC
MAEGKLIQPDLEFVKRVMDSGGESLKKCYQCATCSVVCNMTPDDRPFPRKEMINAQWGLKDKLFANPDIWLCHQCSDCTAYCPRGAKPGEVLGAVRKLSIENYSPIRPLAKAVGSPAGLLFLLAIPVILFGLLIPFIGHQIPSEYLGKHLRVPHYLTEVITSHEPIVYADTLMPVPFIDVVFGAAAFFALIGFIAGIMKYWKALSAAGGSEAKISLVQAITSVITEFLAHKKFQQCEVAKDRTKSHLFVFYGFFGLAITTTWAIVYLYALDIPSPYRMTDPMKLLGNISAVSLLLGIFWVIWNRNANAEKAGKGSYYDWLFISIIAALVVSGILSELLRLANIPVLAYPVYFIHLVVIFFLFAYAPYSKMAHMVYRATALVYAKYTGRDPQ